MKIIILQDEPEIWEKVTFALESTYRLSLTSISHLEALKEVLKKEPIHLLIFDHQTIKREDLQAVLLPDFKGSLIGCQVEGNDFIQKLPPSLPVFAVVNRSELLTQMTRVMGEWVGKNKLDLHETEKFCKIKSKLLLSVCPLKGDIFIRLSETKFVKLFHEGDAFDLADMEKYTVKKGIEYLYIQQKDCAEFIQKYQADLEKLLSQKKSVDLVDAAQISVSLFETVKELGNQFGFAKETQNMAKSYVQLTIQSMGKSPSLSQFLSRLNQLKGDYIAAHSTLCSYFACAIASHLDWASEMTYHKLTLASFLHDITFENETLAACETLAEVEKGKFTRVEKEFFKNHPIQASEIAKKFQEVPPDVDVIILQHHELPDGTGFPRGIHHQRFAPLSSVFMVAHDLSQWMLKKGLQNKEQFNACLLFLKAKYTSSQFRKILETIEKLGEFS